MSRTTERTLDILELFARERRPLTLSEIARTLDLAISSCHDIVRTLRGRGVLYEVAPRVGFYPTRVISDLAEQFTLHDPLLLAAEAALRQARAALDESVALSQPDAKTHELRYLLVLEAPRQLRFSMTVGARVRSLHATSAGRAYLSLLAPEARAELLGPGPLEALTSHTESNPAAVLKLIEAGARRGWFANDEESVEGAFTLSVPLRRNGGVYVLTMAGPSGRLKPRREEAAAVLLTAAESLGQANTSRA